LEHYLPHNFGPVIPMEFLSVWDCPRKYLLGLDKISPSSVSPIHAYDGLCKHWKISIEQIGGGEVLLIKKNCITNRGPKKLKENLESAYPFMKKP